MSRSRNVLTGATMGLIFTGALLLSNNDVATPEVAEVGASDCAIVPPRGFPQPCGDPPLSNQNIREIGIVIGGCIFGTFNGGGPWGCAAGATTAYAGILMGG